jgi:hypothetical protein
VLAKSREITIGPHPEKKIQIKKYPIRFIDGDHLGSFYGLNYGAWMTYRNPLSLASVKTRTERYDDCNYDEVDGVLLEKGEIFRIHWEWLIPQKEIS